MAIKKATPTKARLINTKPKKTRQGNSINTKRAASSRNSASKRYRGQGK